MKQPSYVLQQLLVDNSFVAEPAKWLVAQARQQGLRFLLAHADDGVIWGRIDDDGLHTSYGIAPSSPVLRSSTLQQARLFDTAGEVLIWRSDDGWCARLATDGWDAAEAIIDEDQILWGDTAQPAPHGFTLMREGAQGMCHAVPIGVTPEQLQTHPLRLRVRHYLTENADGEALIVLSRLVQLWLGNQEGGRA